MSATEITSIGTLIVTILGAITIPLFLTHRKERSDQDMASVTSWEGITVALRNERDRLQKRLDESEDRHRAQIDALEKDWTSREAVMRAEIDALQEEVATLKRILRRGPNVENI